MRVTPFNSLGYWSIIGLVVLSSGCGDLIRQDRSPVIVVIDSIESSSGASTTFTGGVLYSDVITVVKTVPSVFSDNGRVTMRIIMKDVGTAPSPVNAVAFNRYRVTYRRADGRNTPGVDVPFGFDSALTFTVPSTGGTALMPFELVRHVAKDEAPLRALQFSAVVISTLAEVTFFGRDQVGNEIQATGTIGIEFGNFGDPS